MSDLKVLQATRAKLVSDLAAIDRAIIIVGRSGSTKVKAGPSSGGGKTRKPMSAETRAKIAAAAKKRWATEKKKG